MSFHQQAYLGEQGFEALLGLSRGMLTRDAFIPLAQSEQRARIAARVAASEQKESEPKECIAAGAADGERREDSDRLRQEAIDRKHAAMFAARERRRTLRKLFDDFAIGYVDQDHFPRVRRIVRQVSNGLAIQTEDLVWLATLGEEYWTEELRSAHHRILAEQSAVEWRESGDPWKAVNACSHWRKAKFAQEALAIAGEALVEDRCPRVRAALLTTRSGALRDLGRYQEAVKHGIEAHALCPDDFRPCTLLGAVHIEMHAYTEGLDWYGKAEARGASRNNVDQEIRAILAAARPEERETIRRALRAHDAVRFKTL